jgi:hypothetical protein
MPSNNIVRQLLLQQSRSVGTTLSNRETGVRPEDLLVAELMRKPARRVAFDEIVPGKSLWAYRGPDRTAWHYNYSAALPDDRKLHVKFGYFVSKQLPHLQKNKGLEIRLNPSGQNGEGYYGWWNFSAPTPAESLEYFRLFNGPDAWVQLIPNYDSARTRSPCQSSGLGDYGAYYRSGPPGHTPATKVVYVDDELTPTEKALSLTVHGQLVDSIRKHMRGECSNIPWLFVMLRDSDSPRIGRLARLLQPS